MNLSKKRVKLENRIFHLTFYWIAAAFILLLPEAVRAEGSSHAGLNQPFVETNATAPGAASTRDILVDIITVGEVINISGCGAAATDTLSYVIETPSGTILPTVTATAAAGKISCTDPMTGPITTAYKYTTTATGRYKVRLINTTATNFLRFDVTVTPSTAVNPDPSGATGIKGRVSSLVWQYATGSFAATSATDANYYVLAPGSSSASNYVWLLDLNDMAGNGYSISANNKGVNAPRSGYSTNITGNTVVPQFQAYLNYPTIASPPPSADPAVTGFRFIDSSGQDYGISPGATTGVQDTGTFEFTTNVSDATYAIAIDVNKNGIFGDAGDVTLSGNAVNGFNSIPWNGTNNAGTVLPLGSYQARAEVRLGEFHFIANDVETSGGPSNGLTIHEATSPTGTASTQVYWDDVTILGAAGGGTSNTPLGAQSGTSAGYHTWGTFDAAGGGFGNNRFVDTYTFGRKTQASLFVAIVGSDAPLTGANGVVTITPTSKPGDALALSVTDADLNSLITIVETVLVTVVNNVTAETETVTLTETGANTGIFAGTLPTAFGTTGGANNSGSLNTQATNTVTVTYNDALTSTGSTAVRTALDAVTGGINGTVSITAASSPGDTLNLGVTDADLNANAAVAETVTVTVVNDATGEIETVVLTETGASTGIFAGTLATVSSGMAGANNSGSINTSATNTLTITYSDAFSANGGPATATASGTVTSFNPITATNDSVGGIMNGAGGTSNVVNVLTGDMINGVAADTSNAILSVASGSTVPAALTFDAATGEVGVAAGASAATYSFSYQICEAANPANCRTATVSVTVVDPVAPIVATNDSIAGVDGATGASNVVNAYTADTINGVAADASNGILSVATGSSLPAGISFDLASGNVSVAAGTAAGNYSFDYQLCEQTNPVNCQTATIFVEVRFGANTIVATNDSVSGVNGASGASDVVNAFTGDTVNGVAATSSNAILSVATGSTIPAMLTFDTATGNVSVVAGTPAGTYSFDYQLCEVLNHTNCSTATISVTVDPSAIVAADDTVAGVHGASGAANVANALTGDTVNGANASSSNAVLSIALGSTVPTGITFDTATGNVGVASGTPAGTYSFDYQLCEALNPSNCQTATISVAVDASALVVTGETVGAVNGASGATNVANAFTGDTVNGVAASASNSVLSVAGGSSVPSAFTFDLTTGNVSVAAGTPAGTYSFDYKLCEALNPSNCRTATISVIVDPSAIIVTGDSATGINGASGAANVANAFTGDSVNGAAATSANAALSVAAGSTVPVGLAFNTATGNVSVAAGTPAGTYSFDYQLCEALNPTNCRTATISVTVDPSTLVVTGEAVGAVNGASGASNVANAFTGDTVNGVAASASNTVLGVATGSTVPVGFTFDTTTGNVSVAAGTPAGAYNFDYQLCEGLNPTNCRTATISVTVAPSAISVAGDSATGVNGASGSTNVVNAFTGDTVNGVAASSSNAILSVATGSAIPTGLIFDTTTGNVSIAAGTPAGTYSFDYQICETLNPTNCRTATISVAVDASALVATGDTVGAVNGASGAANVVNAFAGDTVNGATASASNAILSVAAGSSVPSALTFETTTGNVSVAAGTPAGTYSFDYQLCEALNPANCQIAAISVTVAPSALTIANDGISNLSGAMGAANVLNVRTNDAVNGESATASNSELSVATGSTVPAGLVFEMATGNVSVAAGTPAGTYSFDYQLCETLNPANCRTATVSIEVDAATLVAAADGIASVNGASGANDALNVLDNDLLNGSAVAPTDISLTVTTAASPINGGAVPQLDPATGFVDVPSGTPAGTYAITYQLCERLNPANCQSSTVTIAVDSSLVTTTGDSATGVNGASGVANVANAFAGDSINGVAASSSNALLSVAAGSTVPAGLTFDTVTGNVGVASGTPAGTYSFDYQLCEALNPSNCQTATISVAVNASALVVTGETVGAVNGASGATNVANAFTGDMVNGAAATASNAMLSVAGGSSVPSALTFDLTTGNVSVAAGTPAGTYSFDFQLCEALNPANCETATISITVDPSALVVTGETVGAVNGASGATNVINAFAGDTVNGAAATSSNAILGVAAGSTVPAGLTFDTTTGNVSVAAGTPAGTYSFDYQVCEALNPANCRTAMISITVDPSAISLAADSVGSVNGASGATDVVNILTGDLVNGVGASPSNAVLGVAAGSTVPAGLLFDTATGNVSVAPNTPAGTYSFDYQLCEALNPTNCRTASVSVTVSPSTLVAAPDSVAAVNGALGSASVANVFIGDTVNGAPANAANAILSVASGSSIPGGLTFDVATGNVAVAPGTPAGSYSFDYQLCEALNPTNCVTASIIVSVDAATITLNADAPASINGASGAAGIVNVLGNDQLNGALVNPNDVILTITSPATPIAAGPVPVLNAATGLVDVPAGTPAGSYTITYQVCETLNPQNCMSSSITITVDASPVVAGADGVAAVNGVTGAASVTNVFAGDTINGAAANAGNATLSIAPGSTLPASLGFDPATGNVAVAPNTPAGSYSFDYQICEALNPANCRTATVSITVDPSALVVGADSATGVDGASGAGNVTNAFAGDTVNGAPANASNAILSVASGSTLPSALSFDTATGAVSVAPNTPAGTYSFDYRICEALNPTNCRTATISVTVSPSALTLAADSAANVNGASGAANVANAFAGDTVNGAPATTANAALSIAPGSAVPAGLAFDVATGNVSVAAGTPAGIYGFDYQLCEALNPVNCRTATISISVDASSLSVPPQTVANIDGSTGATGVANAFTGNFVNGVAATPGNATLSIAPGTSLPAGVNFDPATGAVGVAPRTPAGTYVLEYQLCEVLNPTNCVISRITVTVINAAPVAVADASSTIMDAPVTVDVLANDDEPSGDPLTVSATSVPPNGSVRINSDGTVTYTPNSGFIGRDSFAYTVCDPANQCVTQTVSIIVHPSVAALNGIVFLDVNSDRVRDAADPRQPNWVVEIVRDGVVVATVRTDANGFYQANALPLGSGYSVIFRHPTSNVVYGRIDGITLTPGVISVDLDRPIDPSGVIYDSVARTPIAGVRVAIADASGVLLPLGCLLDPSQQNQLTGADGRYRIDMVPGAAAQCPVGETRYRLVVTGPADTIPGQSTVILPETGPFDPTGLASPVTIATNINAPQGSDSTRYFYEFRLGSGDPDVVNNHIPLDRAAALQPLIVSKTSPRRTANVGELVPYTIIVRNSQAVTRYGVDVTDLMPAGFKYVPDSAQVNANEVDPVINARELEWRNLAIPANGSVTISLVLTVGAGVNDGDYTNIATAEDARNGTLISNRGEATVRIAPSPLFDCGDIIGKVFDDLNGNGYQDDGEPGVAGARVVTVNGLLITADQFGRYHVTCAAVPNARIGSNFILKLDARSLPSGYQLTTENPRVVRLTRGKISELDFGVRSQPRVVVKLDDSAFVANGPALTPEWEAKLPALLAALKAEPSIVRLEYAAKGTSPALAETRLKALADRIRESWRTETDKPDLQIERVTTGATSDSGKE
jgi:large repetitive protein